MVQKEAADRLCAQVGSRESGAVTCAVAYYAAAQKLFPVSRGSFLPAPNVDSTVIQLTLHEQPPVTVADEAAYFRLVRSAFGQRRKTAANSISAGLGIEKSRVITAIAQAGLPAAVRAEALTLEQFARLAEILG